MMMTTTRTTMMLLLLMMMLMKKKKKKTEMMMMMTMRMRLFTSRMRWRRTILTMSNWGVVVQLIPREM